MINKQNDSRLKNKMDELTKHRDSMLEIRKKAHEYTLQA
jgi:hypothetical protein